MERKMEYITECITNITELERIIEECFLRCQRLQKESPQNENLRELNSLLRRAKDFEFCIERRKTIHSE